MKEIIETILMVAKWLFTEIFPAIYKASIGAIGDFLDALGYAKAIIIGIIAMIGAAIAWIRKKR